MNSRMTIVIIENSKLLDYGTGNRPIRAGFAVNNKPHGITVGFVMFQVEQWCATKHVTRTLAIQVQIDIYNPQKRTSPLVERAR